MPMQTEQHGMSNMEQSQAEQQGQATRTNAFGQNVFMGVCVPLSSKNRA